MYNGKLSYSITYCKQNSKCNQCEILLAFIRSRICLFAQWAWSREKEIQTSANTFCLSQILLRRNLFFITSAASLPIASAFQSCACEFRCFRHEFGMKIQDESKDAVWLQNERDFSFLWIRYSQILELTLTDFLCTFICVNRIARVFYSKLYLSIYRFFWMDWFSSVYKNVWIIFNYVAECKQPASERIQRSWFSFFRIECDKILHWHELLS